MPQALDHVQDSFTTYLPEALIHHAWADADHRWRERQLGPVGTTYLFLRQVRHGNTACGRFPQARSANWTACCKRSIS